MIDWIPLAVPVTVALAGFAAFLAGAPDNPAVALVAVLAAPVAGYAARYWQEKRKERKALEAGDASVQIAREQGEQVTETNLWTFIRELRSELQAERKGREDEREKRFAAELRTARLEVENDLLRTQLSQQGERHAAVVERLAVATEAVKGIKEKPG